MKYANKHTLLFASRAYFQQPGSGPRDQAARPWPRQVAAWPGGGRPISPLRASGVFRRIRISGIFWDFSSNIDFSPFSAMHGQKQTETGTRLIG